jgi:DNA polymerase-1
MSDLSSKDKKQLFSILKDIEDNGGQKEENANSDVLIIDGNNTYIRGFFKSIGYAIRMLNPTRCIVVFDGVGGSKRRRKILPTYKNKRSTKLRLNRVYEDTATTDIEERSILEQFQKICVMLDELPITTMAIDNIEADDAIAYMCTDIFNTEKTKAVTIMSNDKDFYQLINDRVKVWSPTKKKIYGTKEIQDEFGIASRNYIYFKVLIGDKSDNVDGLKGIGLVTTKKAFPFLSEEEDASLDMLIEFAEDNKNGKLKAHKTISENVDIVRRNYDLMQLNDAPIANYSKLKIQNILDKSLTATSTYQFTLLMKKYKLFSALKNHHVWLRETFNRLDFFTNHF